MGIFDKIKDAAGDNRDKVDSGLDQGVEKAGDAFDQKTGGKYAGQTDKAQEAANKFADRKTDDYLGQKPGQPGEAGQQPQQGEAPDAQQAAEVNPAEGDNPPA